MKQPKLSRALKVRFAQVKLFLCDVDGILTDASVWMGRNGETKRFFVLDGLGIRLLRESGIKVGWISGRPSKATEERALELEIDFLHQSRGKKVEIVEAILSQTGLSWPDTCYMGDDVVDLGILKRVGLAVAVPDAIAEAKALSHYTTQKPGGYGAVREVVDLILKAQNKWEPMLERYLA